MTEQEAEIFVARLTRIWKPEEVTVNLTDQKFRFQGRFTGPSPAQINVRLTNFANVPIFVLKRRVEHEWHSVLGCVVTRGKIKDISHVQSASKFESESIHQFVAEWMLFFRRGCWLSGCPIEATTHEKAEWIQGFSHEEIEAWGLD